MSAARLTDPRAYLTNAVAHGCRLAVCTDGDLGAPHATPTEVARLAARVTVGRA